MDRCLDRHVPYSAREREDLRLEPVHPERKRKDSEGEHVGLSGKTPSLPFLSGYIDLQESFVSRHSTTRSFLLGLCSVSASLSIVWRGRGNVRRLSDEPRRNSGIPQATPCMYVCVCMRVNRRELLTFFFLGVACHSTVGVAYRCASLLWSTNVCPRTWPYPSLSVVRGGILATGDTAHT